MRNTEQHFVYPPILQAARDLRHPLTPVERQLWMRVRNRQLGHKIRRQHPIFRFIADFCCVEAMLVIEIDGDIHDGPKQKEYDKVRTEWLEARGYRLMRFNNQDVLQNIEGVLEAIRAECAARAKARM